ncbi:MAG: hypothetical protein JJU30_08790, partial [Alkalimonas sp.]|nr:hypothetical protein [Alkalimonas sp.]
MSAQAQSLYTECNDCSSAFSFQGAAAQVVDQSTTIVFVGNLNSRTLKKYHVSYERELGQVMLFEVSTSSNER